MVENACTGKFGLIETTAGFASRSSSASGVTS